MVEHWQAIVTIRAHELRKECPADGVRSNVDSWKVFRGVKLLYYPKTLPPNIATVSLALLFERL